MGRASFHAESVLILSKPDIYRPEALVLNLTKELKSHILCGAHLMLIGSAEFGIHSGQALDARTREIVTQLPASHHRPTPVPAQRISGATTSVAIA